MKLSKIFYIITLNVIVNICLATVGDNNKITFINRTDYPVSVTSVDDLSRGVKKKGNQMIEIKPGSSAYWNVEGNEYSTGFNSMVTFAINDLEYVMWYHFGNQLNTNVQLFSLYNLKEVLDALDSPSSTPLRKNWKLYYTALCGGTDFGECFTRAVSDGNWTNTTIEIKPRYHPITLNNNTSNPVTVTPVIGDQQKLRPNAASKEPKRIEAGSSFTFMYSDIKEIDDEDNYRNVSFKFDNGATQVDWMLLGDNYLNITGSLDFTAMCGKDYTNCMNISRVPDFYNLTTISINPFRPLDSAIRISNQKSKGVSFNVGDTNCITLRKQEDYPDHIGGRGNYMFNIDENDKDECSGQPKEFTMIFSGDADHIHWIKFFDKDRQQWMVKVIPETISSDINSYIIKCSGNDCYNRSQVDNLRSTTIEINAKQP